MLKKSIKLNNKRTSAQTDISLKNVRLFLLGQNEIFGLEEVADNK